MSCQIGLVSVVMPAYNAAETITESVVSVFAQSYTQWELIVVNDGSTDGTCKALAPFLGDPRVSLLQQENAGVAAARNVGICHCRGEFVAFLDADDLWEPDKLAMQVELFRSAAPTLGLVHTHQVAFSGDRQCCRPKDDDACFGYLESAQRILVYDFIATSTVMVRAGLFAEVGLFDEALAGTEDWDLWIRILARYEARKIQTVLVRYRESAGGLSGNVARHLLEEWKVIAKQVIGNQAVTSYIREKAIFYHKMKLLNHLLSERFFARLVRELFAAVAQNPLMFLKPQNFRDILFIFYNRRVIRKW
jgi:glycosyltransferase involved in cell wall biosynthesis